MGFPPLPLLLFFFAFIYAFKLPSAVRGPNGRDDGTKEVGVVRGGDIKVFTSDVMV